MTTGCRCDQLIHPEPLDIAAGMDRLPRQIASFPEFRRAMLAAIPTHPVLSHWSPGGGDDLGEMLLEMWAYVCDSLAFYDEVIAHEAYLRTARRRPSVRKLTGLTGHVPTPAVAAVVELGIVADGRKPLTLPARTGFRSGAFNGEAPQVFEIATATSVHPLTSKWTLQPPRPDRLGVAFTSSLLLKQDTANLAEGDIALLRFTDVSSSLLALGVNSVEDHEGDDGETYARVTFERLLFLGADRSPSTLRLEKPANTGGLWKDAIRFKPGGSATGPISTVSGGSFALALAGSPGSSAPSGSSIDAIGVPIKSVPGSAGATSFAAPSGSFASAGSFGAAFGGLTAFSGSRSLITLDGLYRGIKPGDFIILARGDDRRGFRVEEVREEGIRVSEGQTTEIEDKDGNVTDRVTGPDVYAPVTHLLLDTRVDLRMPPGGTAWGTGTSIVNELVLHYGFASAGVVTVEAKTRIENGDPLVLQRPVEVPQDDTSPTRFLLQDLDENALASDGAAQLSQRTISLGSETDLGDGLAVPVKVFGNVIEATRGETVSEEALGSGDASQANQSFQLKQKPLTYVSAPVAGNQSGVTSTLKVRVDGVLWEEVRSFFGRGPDEEVYIVRQDDEGESIITFGDGIRGARLPTGQNNVTATYRHGAGAAAPPSGSITQMAKPVEGVTSVVNPVPAFGGSDAEDREEIRKTAPRSALTLGRAVSLVDMEALAARVPGVRAAKADWRWQECRQRPVVQVWYIGDEGLESRVSETLRSATDPATPIDVSASTPIPLHLSIAVKVDERYVASDVLSEVEGVLLESDTGLLPPKRLGIGGALIRSQLFEQILSVEGAVAVESIQFRREDPPSLQVSPAYTASIVQISQASLSQATEPATPGFAGWSVATLTDGGLAVIGSFLGPISFGEDVIIQPGLQPLLTFALTAPDGHHFDIEEGSLTLSASDTEAENG